MKRAIPLLATGLLAACGSAGPYGFSRSYAPLDAEAEAAADAVEYDPVMAQRKPAEWRRKDVMLFGVVKRRTEGPGGAADLALSVRRLEKRNLCETEAEDSCRVTVSDREHALVHAYVHLDADDEIGKESVGPGSLMRVIGKLGDEVHPDDGASVLHAKYYRHWPRGYYVTTAARAHMRR